MPKKAKPKPDDKNQSARFIEAARSLDTSKTKETFDRALKTIIQPKKLHAK